MKKIKLIWDFFGEDALETAKHHAIHLAEYQKKFDLKDYGCGSEEMGDHAEAYLIVEEEKMISVRDALRPKRGEWVD